jgi:hypothetical protein
MRITQKDLEARVERLNGYAKQLPNRPHYELSCAYGGYALHRVVNELGAVTDVFDSGHIPGRELFQMLGAMILGLTLGLSSSLHSEH